ncbi:MAG TPA: GTP 3',8-cyclase MoaA [Gammaproteobacteria bacterium]|nr:GTP 3',8-cyclase MoaA [Gammaproteobacteria bacterium]
MDKFLIDRFGRSFPYLRLSVTDVCNFKCSYCLPDGYKGDAGGFLGVDEIRRLIAGFAELGTRKVRLTGGEPTLRKDFLDIARVVSQTPGIETVAMTTNGYKLPQRAQSFYDAGVNAINISIDGLTPERFELITGKNRFEEVMDGLNLCREIGFAPVKVNAVLLKDLNDSELDAFIQWACGGVNLRFIELMETGENRAYFDKYHLSGDVLVKKLVDSGWSETARDVLGGPARVWKHPNQEGSVGLIAPYSRDFCTTCNRLRVSAKGGLHLCLFGDGGHDLRPLLQRDSDKETLKDTVCELLDLKVAGHGLHDRHTGATPHFASIGG